MAVTSELRLKAVDQVSGVISKIQRAFPRLNSKIDASRKRLKMLDDKFGDVLKTMGRVGDRMKSVGRGMSTFVTLPLVAMGAASVRAFTKYEKSLVGVGKTSDIRGKKLENLGNKFLDLSKRIPLAVSELLSFGEVAGQSDIKDPKGIIKFAEVMGKLRFAAPRIQGEEGAIAIARILGLTKTPVALVDRFADALVHLGNNTKVFEDEILGVANRVSGGLQRFDVGFKKILAISATARELGHESEVVGSVMQRAFMGIEQAVLTGGKPMVALRTLTGLSTKELKRLKKEDPFQIFDKMLKGLRRVQKEGGNLKKVLKIFDLQGVRVGAVLGSFIENQDRLRRNLKLTNEAVDEGTKSVGALDSEFEQAADTLDSKFKIALNRTNSLMTKIGKTARKNVAGGLEKIGDVLQSIEQSPGLIKMGIIIGGILAIMGPLILAFGTIVALLPTITAGFAAMGLGLGAGFALLFGIPLLIAALVVGLAAIIVFWDETVEIATGAWITIKESANAFWEDMKTSASGFIEWLKNALDFSKGVLGRLAGAVGINISGQAGGVAENAPQGADMPGVRDFVLGGKREAPKAGGNVIPLNQKAELEIKVDGPPGTTVKVKRQQGFDSLNINRGFQGVGF